MARLGGSGLSLRLLPAPLPSLGSDWVPTAADVPLVTPHSSRVIETHKELYPLIYKGRGLLGEPKSDTDEPEGK